MFPVILFVGCIGLASAQRLPVSAQRHPASAQRHPASAQRHPVSTNDAYRDRTNLRSNLQSNHQRNERWRQTNPLGTASPAFPIDTVVYDTTNQPTCREIKRGPVGSRECGWNSGLSRDVDQFYLNGRIAAYKTQWEHGPWSEWYVPGVNDIDIKFNIQSSYCQDYEVRPNSMRRWWAYFNEYTHIIILCEDQTKQV